MSGEARLLVHFGSDESILGPGGLSLGVGCSIERTFPETQVALNEADAYRRGIAWIEWKHSAEVSYGL